MYIGIDVGGTNLKAGLVDENGVILAEASDPCGTFADGESFAARLAELSRTVCEKADVALDGIQSVGMGVPGAVDGGTILYTCNIPMERIPMAALFARHFSQPLYMANDADCAALGEYWRGAGRGCSSLVAVTLGTGIGGGIVLDGKLYRGLGSAGEVGHMTISEDGPLCNCGRRGCWETYASATGLKRMTWEAMEAHPESAMWQQAESRSQVTGRTAFQAMEAGDATGKAVCQRYIETLAAGLTNLVNALHPEVVAIGGGVSNEKEELLLQPVRRLVEERCFARHGGAMTRIVKAELGNRAGIIGAAFLGKSL